jgi:peptidyl-dipeptidase A
MKRWLVFVCVCASLILAGRAGAQMPQAAKDAGKKSSATAAEAQKFIEEAEQKQFDLGVKASRASWVQEKTDPRGMVKYGENFFTSLGFAPLPKTFWERSLFTKPADRDVVCHASAWDVDSKDDLRIKLCIQIREEDFRVIHHELGHNFYQRAYSTQPPLFQSSANDGFHEAVGDTIALSVTPEYLKQIGLIDAVPVASGDTDYLLQQALEKVAFLPFGLLVDKWRWEVFAGQVKLQDYKKA